MASPIQDKQANRRVRLLGAVLVLALAAMFGRAFWLQVVDAAQLAGKARVEHEGPAQSIPALRGTIFDRTGIPLAIGEQRTTIYADPHQVRNARAIALAASSILGIDANALYPALLNKASQFVYVARFADPAKAARFLKKGFAGVNSYPEERRTYPEGSVGAQVVGYAGVDDTGLGGLELGYNASLAGRAGSQTVVLDPSGRVLEVLASKPPVEGANLFTTIDHTIQAQAEWVLRKTVKAWGAKDATAVVLDPSTGEVLAMAQTPIYNDNSTPTVSAADLRNRAVTDTYEPGSTFKLVTITGALSEGLVTPSTRFTLPYDLRYGPCAQCTVHDAEFRPTESLAVAQILSQSSNVGAVTIARKLGPRALQGWIEKFGFGSPTGIDFPGESAGFVLPLPQWSETTIGNVPIGQGISVTPIQMASVYAAVANGGVWIQPHLVDRVSGNLPTSWRHRRIMSPQVDAEVKTMLTGVVADPGATGNEAKIPGYTVAGKTGTAQVSDGHGYSTTDYTASFVGMVPASHPRLVVLVKVDDPRGSIFGGVVSAPAFAAIAKFDLQYLEVPPDAPAGRRRTVLSRRTERERPARRARARLARAMMLERLIAALGPAEVVNGAPVEVTDLAYDARTVTPGALFFCVRGAKRRRPRLRARRRAGRWARPRSWSSVCSRSRSPSSSSPTCARRCRVRRPASSEIRRGSSRSPPSPAPTARRRPPSCCTRSSEPRAARAASSRTSSAASAASRGRPGSTPRRRSISSGCSGRWSTRATVRACSRRPPRRAPRAVSRGYGSRCSFSRI